MGSPRPLSTLQLRALEQLKKTPKIAMDTSLDGRYRHAWFPDAPGVRLDGRTVDALERKGYIRWVWRNEPEYDWRWVTYLPTGNSPTD